MQNWYPCSPANSCPPSRELSLEQDEQVKTCSPGWIFTSSHLLRPKAESSKAVTLKSASLGALHAVDNSCNPGAPAHLHRLLKQQAPHRPQLW